MKIIGITGGTGAGKTTALHALRTLGADIIDCDAVYHDLLRTSDAMLQELTGRFGDILTDGSVDRKKLAGVVFTDPDALSDLNAITHRYIGIEVRSRIDDARRADRRAVAIDAIALLESDLCSLCDAVVGVIAPPELRIRRIMAREGISEDYARQRVFAQKSEDYFRARCTHILENNGDDPDAFREAALALFGHILNN